MADKQGNISVHDKLELIDQIVKPLESSIYMSLIPLVQKKCRPSLSAKGETMDTLYNKVKSISRKYIDTEDGYIITPADILYS